MSNFASLPGFRDFYPADLRVRSHIMQAWRGSALRYGFEEYDGPPLEALELYTEKSGEEIIGQLFSFTDKGGRAVSLRPEMTPTLARMVGARAGGLRKPVRWFCMPQLFRYETPQRGRLREHFQWNVDIIGEDDIAADAEVLAVALDALRALGLGAADLAARYSDRRLMERLMLHLGVAPERLGAAYAAIDKLGRDDDARIRERLRASAGLDEAGCDAVFAIVRSEGMDAIEARFGGAEGVGAELERLRAYQAALHDLGFGEWIRFDPGIVRGLAYYTGVVFEVFDRQGRLRAICGGGRYDRLLEQLGGVALPAVGFGMGDVVLRELLDERGLLPAQEPALDYFIVAITEAERPLQRRLAQALRGRGHSVAYALRGAGVGRQFKEADARGARHALVLGPDEAAAGVVVEREMGAGTERRLDIDALLADGVAR
jgi:histidyl-tRNA synthetase